ncbi:MULTISPECIES: DNA alkylation repair protein [unclassified Arthrobacter]|uniref:DNA alkylation repair protein n=1 Tax=unclassified Arthrobacter TaxID=235627 RepID=UPI002E013819|nr:MULTISPECIES: DNA alkylation repair protein [unclassified Arthrobacter]MEC5191082.1 3-methyladenine DNA glycosylase AlkD [Arthrobacter sp. MP_M4]MEC5202253.1 3-methyladenine DNA glycosylase AlkD [Arthrobacter sp. MP_M7]
MSPLELVGAIRSLLQAAADPARAAGAQAYLKSALPCLGVQVPEVRRMVKTAVKERPPGSLEDLESAVLELWRDARWREERYAAIDLTGLKLAAGEMGMLPLYEEIIRSGAWWDLVDGVSHRLCNLLHAHREDMSAVLLRWSTDRDLWIRRAAITAQLGAKTATDPTLLAAVIEPNLADREFFIRKAIGWALRDYAATNPAWVKDFAARHADTLSPLSRREALRRLK